MIEVAKAVGYFGRFQGIQRIQLHQQAQGLGVPRLLEEVEEFRKFEKALCAEVRAHLMAERTRTFAGAENHSVKSSYIPRGIVRFAIKIEAGIILGLDHCPSRSTPPPQEMTT